MQQLNLIQPAPALETFELRPYQAQAIEETRALVQAGHRRILMYQGCGAGKTCISTEMIRRAAEKNRKVLFLVHLDTLVGQTYEKIQWVGLECGFIKAGWPENPWSNIQIGSVQTMAKRSFWRKLKFDLIILDEAHILAWHKMADQILALNPNAVVILLTATPFRTSAKEGMGDKATGLVVGPMPTELRDQGFLVPLKYFSLPQADLSGVKKKRGDFDESMLSIVCDKPELIERAIDEWFLRTEGLRTIAFCVNQKHAQHLASAFRRRGIAADCVIGDTSPKERKRMYAALRSGKILVLTSCNVISIGFDEPSVEVGLMLRPTQSLALHYQMLGRIQRISPKTGKKIGIILDQAGNAKRLGPIEALTKESISLAKGRKVSFDFGAVMKECPHGREDGHGHTGCGHIMIAFMQSCPECGYVFPKDNWIEQTQSLEELIMTVPQVQRDFFVRELKACISAGRSPGQAQMKFHKRFYSYPKPGHTRRALYDHSSTENAEAYFRFLASIALKQNKQVGFVKGWMTREFGEDWKQYIPEPDQAFNQLKLSQMALALR